MSKVRPSRDVPSFTLIISAQRGAALSPTAFTERCWEQQITRSKDSRFNCLVTRVEDFHEWNALFLCVVYFKCKLEAVNTQESLDVVTKGQMLYAGQLRLGSFENQPSGLLV